MKFTAIVFIAQLAGVLAGCGDLGDMQVPDQLPKGTDPNAIRQCLEHPLGAETTSLSKRECWEGVSSGCTKGFCWKTCNATPGAWCWTAKNGGFGDWITCNNNNECSTAMSCGQGDCEACGCSC